MVDLASSRLSKPIWRRWWAYVPLLVGPAAIVGVACYDRWLGGRFANAAVERQAALDALVVFLEWLGPYLLAAATAAYWLKAVFTRNLTYTVLTALSACLLLRELHWEPPIRGDISIKDAIYPLLGLCLLWAILWRDLMDRPAGNPRHTMFFFAALATYGLSQLIEKKILGKRIPILPNHAALHSQYEEAVECCGHLLLLVAAVVASWRRRKVKYEKNNDEARMRNDETMTTF